MLARLKRASRRCIALVWAMMLVFALAPVVGVANGAPAGVFSHVLLHSHADGDLDHVHHGHDHHHHDHDGHHHDHDGHHHDDATDDGPDDQGEGPLHVHYDANCPTVLMPVPTAHMPHRVAERVTLAPVDARQGAPPGPLLRPPILAL